MVSINFYHAVGETPAAVDAILPQLLEKAHAGGLTSLLVAPTHGRRTRLDEALWGHTPHAFLPHATVEDANAARQPILLATVEDDLSAHLAGRLPLVLAGAEAAWPVVLAAGPEKAFYLLSGAAADVERGRTVWKELKGQGHTLAYWQQSASGWQKKA